MRAAASDFLQNFRFHVKADRGGVDPLQASFTRGSDMSDGAADAGFTSVTTPELTIEMSEYREGTFVWTQKYPGVPSVSDVSLIRGAVKRDTDFFDMAMASVNGQEYRADVTIMVYQRVEMNAAKTAAFPDGAKRIICKNAFAIRAKVGSDLDAMTSDVSTCEADLSIESFEVKYE